MHLSNYSNENPLPVRKFFGVTEVPNSFRDLVSLVGRDEVFLSPEWFENFENTVVGNSQDAVFYGVESFSREALGGMFLWKTDKVGKGLSPRLLRSLGNFYTPVFEPYIGPNSRMEDKDVVNGLVGKIWSERKDWDLLDLRPLDPCGGKFELLVNCFREVGAFVQTYFCFGNWYLGVGGRTFEEYFHSLPSALRNKIPYKIRRLEREGSLEIKIITGMHGIEEGVDSFEQIYQKSWRNTVEPYPRFIRGLARTMGAKGWLRLGILSVDDVAVASQFWIVQNKKASIFKLCYDENFSKRSVGTILSSKLFEHVIEQDKVELIDYLSGDEPYKEDWMSHRREKWGILVMNPYSGRGLLQIGRHLGGRWIKKVMPQIRRQG